jgi:hypothetical protein
VDAEGTTLRAVRRAMDELAAEARSPDDTVVVYLSTHGTLDRSPGGGIEQYLVLGDTQVDDIRTTALSHDEVLTWLDALPSRKKLAVLATCHSGQGKSAFSPSMEAEARSSKGIGLAPLREVSEAIVLIGVCAWNETARESPALGHDIYTWYFLEALGLGDANGDGAVTATEAHDRARDQTYTFTKGAQRAYARAEIVGSDPIVLSGRKERAGRPSIGTYATRWDGLEVAVDGTSKGVMPGVVQLDAGVHTVEVVAPDTGRVVARQRVHVRDGTLLDLGDLVRRDFVRVAIGGAFSAYSGPIQTGPTVSSELHFPRIPGRRWEVVLHGSASLRWPNPTLDGGVVLERPLNTGPVQLRAGVGAHSYLLGADGLLAPSIVPEPVAALVWLPRQPIVARLSASGGYLWYTDGGSWHHGWTTRIGLVAGGAF